jgi:hypothetical protein
MQSAERSQIVTSFSGTLGDTIISFQEGLVAWEILYFSFLCELTNYRIQATKKNVVI